MQQAIERLKEAQDLAAREVLRRELKGFRREVTERALVDHYFAKLTQAVRA